ncbi:hypothetical protein ACWONS_003507 [Vibrio parahaemolyticus]
MSTQPNQESVYGEWTEATLPEGTTAVLVQNQSTVGLELCIFTGTEPPSDFTGILLYDWISFPIKDGDKLFHTPVQKPHPAFNQASIRVDAV